MKSISSLVIPNCDSLHSVKPHADLIDMESVLLVSSSNSNLTFYSSAISSVHLFWYFLISVVYDCPLLLKSLLEFLDLRCVKSGDSGFDFLLSMVGRRTYT